MILKCLKKHTKKHTKKTIFLGGFYFIMLPKLKRTLTVLLFITILLFPSNISAHSSFTPNDTDINPLTIDLLYPKLLNDRIIEKDKTENENDGTITYTLEEEMSLKELSEHLNVDTESITQINDFKNRDTNTRAYYLIENAPFIESLIPFNQKNENNNEDNEQKYKNYQFEKNEKILIPNIKEIKVMKYDTLSEIANDFEVELNQLIEWNDIEDPSLIVVGDTLKLHLNIEQLKKYNQYEERRNKRLNEKNEEIKKRAIENVLTDTRTPKQKMSEKVLTMTATAYVALCDSGCTGITATGINLIENPHKKVIAVDPSVIPLGTKVYVEGYGEAIAGDTGGSIKGNKIDVHLPTYEAAKQWGIRTVKVTILD